MTLPDDFRARAKIQRDLANQLLTETDVLTNPTKLVSSIVGQINATVLETQADMMDFMRLTAAQDAAIGQRSALIAKMNSARMAAARGDWDEFDRLSGGDAQPGTGR